MIVSLRGNQRLLHTRQNLFCLRQRQPQIGDLGKPGGSIDLYQVDTICRDVGPVSTSRKIQPMHDPPVKKTKTVVSSRPHTPNLWTVPSGHLQLSDYAPFFDSRAFWNRFHDDPLLPTAGKRDV